MTSHEFARYLLEKCPDVPIYYFDGEGWSFETVVGCLWFARRFEEEPPRLTIKTEERYFPNGEDIR